MLTVSLRVEKKCTSTGCRHVYVILFGAVFAEVILCHAMRSVLEDKAMDGIARRIVGV